MHLDGAGARVDDHVVGDAHGGGGRAEEVERALALGARLLQDHTRPDGGGWVTLTDPEGNEFCVEREAST